MEEQKPKRRGPKSVFDDPEKCKELEKICRLNPSLEDVAAWFEVDTSTIEKFVKRRYKMKFSAFRQKNMAHTRLNLRNKMTQKALNGDNLMMIYLSKKMLPEFAEDKPKETKPIEITLNYNLDKKPEE